MVRVRFAPSPTGHLHIGGARTALFNYLFARKNNGKVILRIEDTDLKRSSPELEEVIIRDLKWLGIDWDEGPDKGGEFGPYRSTDRKHIYKNYVDKLLEEDKAYYCYCTPEELEAERQRLLEEDHMPMYMGKCRNLTQEQKKAYEKEGKRPTIRFKVPENQTIIVDDIIRGKVKFDSNGIGDFVIVKSDGLPVYNFAVVIDDHLMEITHIIRGEEHLSNTPSQILLYNALGFNTPKFAHVSLILGKDRSKMSKRHGSTWVEQYRDDGYLPEAVVNFLALLGWSPEGEEEKFCIEDLCEFFSLDRVAKNPAVFDIDKLNWMNGCYIRESSLDDIAKLASPYLIKAGYIKEEDVEQRFDYIKKIVDSVREGVDTLSEIPGKAELFFDEKLVVEDEEAKEFLQKDHVFKLYESFKGKVEQAEEIDEDFTKNVFKEIQKETGIKGKNLYMTIRLLVSGRISGPELVRIMEVLGKDKILERLNYAKDNYISLT
ncbi:MAG TPA: glutamate--tRNA ligase [Thermoanaerobacterales bacterium]|nr:glutamate--tRNA ligase [Thermoanaerobacterales bacterium]